MKKPMRVAVTGAAGQIGYSLLFRIASGDMLGRDQPVILQLLEIPDEKAQKALKGVMMELDDCAFPLLQSMVAASDPKVAFKDVDVALLVGARPRGPGMERKDLLEANGAIFVPQGKALDAVASRDVKVLVVGNPANTNSLIAMKNAPSLKPTQFTAMMRLDHNRSLTQIAQKTGKAVTAVRKMSVWGNHSATQYPDIFHAEVDGQNAAKLVLGGLRGLRRHRPRARLGRRHQRLGLDGHPVGRQLRHPRGPDVRLSRDLLGRQVPGRAGPRAQRLRQGQDRRDAQGAGRRARRDPAPAQIVSLRRHHDRRGEEGHAHGDAGDRRGRVALLGEVEEAAQQGGIAGRDGNREHAAQRGRAQHEHRLPPAVLARAQGGQAGQHPRFESAVVERARRAPRILREQPVQRVVVVANGHGSFSFVARRSRNFAFARMMWVFTVPSGSPSAAAASSWERSA
jgi:hypothetical protein